MYLDIINCLLSAGEANTESRTTSGTNRCQAGFGAELFDDGTTVCVICLCS